MAFTILLPLAILGQLSGQLSKELRPLKPPMDLLLDNSNLLWSTKAYTSAPWSSNFVFLLFAFLFFCWNSTVSLPIPSIARTKGGGT